MISVFLKKLRRKGVKLWISGEVLKFKTYHNSPLINSDREYLRENKTECIAWLKNNPEFFERLPLSENQKSLWLVYQMDKHSTAYNLAHTVGLIDGIDILNLERAFELLCQEHTILRTIYADEEGEGIQYIHNHLEPRFSIEDAQALTRDDIIEWAKKEADKPFDLTAEQACRATLLRNYTEAGIEVIFQLTAHHIVADFWSCEIIFNELMSNYKALQNNCLTQDKRDHIHDYFSWSQQQQHWLMSNDTANDSALAALKFWEKSLGDDSKVLELPADAPRPPVQTYNGEMIPFRLSDVTSNHLRERAKSLGVTPFIVCLSIFQIFLFRYSSQEKFFIGTPASGRLQQEHQKTIGYLVNPIVLACDCEGNPTFRDLINRVNAHSRAALAHQSLPFSCLLDQLNIPRDLSRNPVFQHLFALTHIHPHDHQGLIRDTYLSEQRGAAVDLSLVMLDDRDGFTGEWRYNTDLYTRQSALRMIDSYLAILDGVCHSPDIRINDVEIMTEHVRQQVLEGWNETATDFPGHQCIHALFEAQVEKYPTCSALVFEGEQLNYRQLNNKANQLAHYLIDQHGIKPDTLIGVCLDRSLDMVICILGVLKAGAAYVPLEPSYPTDRLAYICGDACLGCVLTTQSLIERLSNNRTPIICVDDNAYNTRIAEYNTHNIELDTVGIASNHLAYVIYTSGSTGQPKGVMVEHRSLVNQIDWLEKTFGSTPDDRFLLKTPFSFDVSISEFMWPLTVGACLVIAKPEGHRDPEYLSTLIQKQKITKTHFVPAMLSHILAAGQLGSCSSLAQVFSAGEALSMALVESFNRQCPNVDLYNLYGPTEATIFACGCAPYCNDAKYQKLAGAPIGYPVQNTQLYVLNNSLKPVPPGVIGELYIGGVGLARGYLNRNDLTAEKFIANPFYQNNAPSSNKRLYKTGDMVRWLSDGNIEYIGRSDFQIKLRGLRIELGEIENALKRHADVQEALVLVTEHDGYDQRLVAYVVPQSEKHLPQPDESANSLWLNTLRTSLSRSVPDYMRPSTFVVLKALPLSPNGKIDRKALPEPELSTTTSHYIEPVTDTEKMLCNIWQEVVCIENVGAGDNFFLLGGNSLLATKALAKIKEQLHVEISLKMLFEKNTLRELAVEIDRLEPKMKTSTFNRMDSLLEELGV